MVTMSPAEQVRVHQVAKELPAGWRLEEGDAQVLRDEVDGAGGRHRAGERLEAALVLEPRDEVGVRGDDGERVGRRHEEAAAEDHVAVGVAVGGGAEDGRGVGGGRDLAVGGEAHPRDELGGVRQVRVGVAAAKVLLRLAVEQRVGVDAEHLAE